MLQCCVVLLPEAVVAKLCQPSTETGPQDGVVEIPANRSPLACGENIWHGSNYTSGTAVSVLGRERPSSPVVLECMNKLA